eukprot:symbB.v1.2.019201.t1/scaffold1512.1/size114451/12
MASGDSSFHRHLMALNAEYERLITENEELRRGGTSATPIFNLRYEDSPPPRQPLTAFVEPAAKMDLLELPCMPDEYQGEGGEKEIANRNSNISNMSRSPKNSTRRQRSTVAAAVPQSEEADDSSTFLLMLDVIPAGVIMMSAAVAGLSADIEPDHEVWRIFEIAFTAFFIGECFVKMKVFGIKEYVGGADWYWSWFDILCVVLAIVDLSITSISAASSDGGADTGAMSSLKMLKLARLGRIVRLLKFKIFQELKLMIQGVFTGLRVLFWAVVLLVGCMYLLGVVTRTLIGNVEELTVREEFGTVPAAMFTCFRCFTDGCAATDGTPLQEHLRKKFGSLFMFPYILLFLFVTIGIFNLIMAVFIDNVADGSTKKRQRQLGQNAPKTAWLISSALRHIILTNLYQQEEGGEGNNRRMSKLLKEQIQSLQEMYGYKAHTNAEYEEKTEQIRQQMTERDVVVTKDEFNTWLNCEKELISRLDESEIDMSCKSDLFDVLDADLSGELEFEEMVDGLLKCRGPVSKTDIIAIRLKSSLIVRMMNAVCEKLGIQDV